MLSSLLILAYSLGMLLLTPVARLLGLLWKKLGSQLIGRQLSPANAAALARARSEKRGSALFFCSSAGEYEQAKPLIDRLEKKGDVFVHVCFFSRSGMDYVDARGDQISRSLSPIDSVWTWGVLFSALRPDQTFVVRHELWPAFLTTARYWGRLYLLDASRSEGEAQSRLKRFTRSRLLGLFDHIFVVDAEDLAFFKRNYNLSLERLSVSGDTKFDRVRERALDQAKETSALKKSLLGLGHRSRRFIVGSAHKPDLEIALAARRLVAQQDKIKNWLLIIAPHDISPAMVRFMDERIKAEGLKVAHYSRLLKHTAESQDADVLLVDAMGHLAEFYGACDAAFVGGAMHHQVHNVLEPACRGLPLAFGPFYKNSKEAKILVNADAAQVVAGPDDLASWWLRQDLLLSSDQPGFISANSKTLATVERLCGASDLVIESIYAR